MPRDNGYVKVFCNSIGWVKSAKSVADYNRLPKVLINSAELLTYSQRRYGQILMIFLQSCKSLFLLTVDKILSKDIYIRNGQILTTNR